MNPSPEAIAAICERVTDWAQSDAAIADALNTQTEPNPAPQGNVLPAFNFEQVAACLQPSEIAHIKEFNTTQRLLNDVDAQNHMNVARWAAISAAAGDVSPQAAQAVQALVMTPIPDPDYQGELPAPLLWLGRMVDIDDVATAREIAQREASN